METTTRPIDFAMRLRDQILPLRSQADVRNSWLRQRLDGDRPGAHGARRARHVDRRLPRIQRGSGHPLAAAATGDVGQAAHGLGLQPQRRMAASSDSQSVATDSAISTMPPGIPKRRARRPREACGERARSASIGIDVADEFAFGDGLSHHEYEWLSRRARARR